MFAMIGCTSDQEKTAEIFKDLRRTTAKMNAVLNVNANYIELGNQLTEIMTEFSIIDKNKIVPKSRYVYDSYFEYIEVIKAIHSLWRYKINTRSPTYNNMGIIELGNSLPPYIKKYDILHIGNVEDGYLIPNRDDRVLLYLIKLSRQEYKKLKSELREETK